MVSTIQRSKFCLQPPGDQPNRKSVIDSLLLGCIPVLFHEAQLDYIPWHWTHKFTSSVFFDYEQVLSGKVDVVGILRKLTPGIINGMQKNIASFAYGLQYGFASKPNSPDAFDIIIAQLGAAVDKLGILQTQRQPAAFMEVEGPGEALWWQQRQNHFLAVTFATQASQTDLWANLYVVVTR